MSWMDSWSRPSKSQPTPPPLYLTVGDSVPYCRSCGRVIGQRKSQASQEVKYCSARCRNNKPGPLDRKIESVFASLLESAVPELLKENGEESGRMEGVVGKKKSDGKKKITKGDARVTVECSTVEEIVFPRHRDPTKIYGRRKNRAARGLIEEPQEPESIERSSLEAATTASEGSADGDVEAGGILLESDTGPPTTYGYGSGKVRPPQAVSDINGSIGGERGWAERTSETDEMKAKRQEGQRRAEEREMVRRAARRACAFGLDTPVEKRKCEAIMRGSVVESSFAKGEWGIRWREKY